MPLLKLKKDDPQKEMEFEVQCSLQMLPEERLRYWLEWNLTMLKFMKQQEYESKKNPQIIKRP